MKELFPLKTFQQDAVLQRLKELYDNEVDLDTRLEPVEEEISDIKDGTTHLFENITDAQGHKRFVEGSINIAVQTGLTINFAKWSLSGSHLMIVVAGSVSPDNQATLSLNTEIALPQWIKDKIYPLGHGDNVAYSTIFLYNDLTFHVSEESAILIKPSGGELGIYHTNYIGDETAEIDFRVQFDLVIDNT